MLKIEKSERLAIMQYLLIYIMIQYIGGRVAAAVGADLFYGATITLCIFLFFMRIGDIRIEKRFFMFCVVLVSLLFITALLTAGALSIGTILSVFSRFLIVYVSVAIDKKNFLFRLLKLVFIFSCISLILFIFVQIMGTSVALGFFSKLYEIKNGNYWLGSSYGLFLVCYNFMDATRNTYMFGEPGEYQSLIIMALYFLFFLKIEISNRKKIRYATIFIVTVLTIQSTTGYFNLIVLVLAMCISRRGSIAPALRKYVVLFLTAVGIYLVISYSPESFLYKNFIAKIFSDSGSLDMTVGTGDARIGPMLLFLDTIRTVPGKLIFGVGYDGISNTPMLEYSTGGLINSVVMLGILTNIWIYGKMFTSLKISGATISQYIFVIFFVINMGLSQPDLLAITSVLMCLYGEYGKIKSANKTCTLNSASKSQGKLALGK